MNPILIIVLISVLVDGLDYKISFSGTCAGGHIIQGTAWLEVHGSPIHCWVDHLSLRISGSILGDITRARVTLHGRSATLFDKYNREYMCWLDNYSDPVKTFRLLDMCPNEITYVSGINIH
jgi:hypothetical protein